MKVLFAVRTAFLLLLAFVTFLTLTTDPDDAKAGFDLFDWIASLLVGRPDLGDKFAHFSAYGALGFAGGAAQWRILGRQWPVVPALAAYGVALEVLQHLGGVRDGNAFDAGANALGAAAGLLLFALLTQLLKRRAAA